jgi:zinc protease
MAVGLVLVAVLALGVAGLASRSTTGRSATVPRLDLRTEKYRLGNGLEVILRRESRLPVVAVNLWYHVGPANEEAGRTGFAHLFEHMMFEGSGHVDEGEADRLLEATGTSENASTNFDYTNYIVPDVPANQLELALWLQSDRMGFLLDRLDQASLSNQQAVVRNERRENYDDAPYGLADEELYHRLFPAGHPYHADIIGSHADIQAARLDDVRAFFRQYYVPNNASLVIVGDIDVARTRTLVEKYFGTIAGGGDVPRRVVPAPPLAKEERVSLTDTVELPRVTMGWLTPAIFEPGDYDAAVTSRLLNGTRASRLSRRLEHDLRIAQSVSTDVDSMANGSVFTVTATAKPGHTLAELEAAIDAELADLARRGPTRAEVEAAKTAVIARAVRGLDNLGGFGGLADQLNFFNHYRGDPGAIDDDLHRTAAVTAERVRRFAARHLDPGRRVVVEVAPGPKMPVEDPPTPSEPDTTDGAAGAEPEAPPASAEPWRDTVPEPGPAPTTPAPPVRRFTLDNGLAVWLVESHRLPTVSASLVSRLGSAADPPDRPGLADLTTGALDGGTTQRDALGLSRELEAAGATLGDDTGKDGTWLTAASLTGHAHAAVAILADVARNPTFPADEVERVRDAAIVALRQSRDDADAIAGTVALREVYGAGHPYGHRSTGTEDGLRAATIDDLRRAHARAFTPATTALLLSGDLTEPDARRLAGDAFGMWTGDDTPTGGAAGSPDPGPPAGSPDRVLLVDKPDASQTALVLAAPGLARSDPDFELALVTNQVLGGGFSSRLNANLRETHGYTYGAYSDVDALRGIGLISMDMAVQTPSTADAVGEALHEAETLAGSGVTTDELARSTQYLAGSARTLFDTNSSTLSTLRTLYLDDLPADYYETRPARLARITTADVAGMARRRFAPDAFTVVAVGDRAAIEAPLRALNLGPVALRSP